MAKKQKYYVVWQGHKPGVYSTWADCQQQIQGFSGAKYKSFVSESEAKAALDGVYDDFVSEGGGKSKTQSLSNDELEAADVRLDSISVDAACAGNPGVLEYRGVETESGLQLFHVGPLDEGTVNLGEFLAIVHGLAMLQKEKRTETPIYTDSRTAMKWVSIRDVRTKLTRSRKNQRLFVLVDRAREWLHANEYANPILKWETANWGEIRADFGRK